LPDRYESDTEKKDLLSEFKYFWQLYKQMLQEVQEIYDALHFLEIREMSGISSKRFACQHASSERIFSILKQIKSYTRSAMDEIRLLDLSVLNIEREFSKNLDFNSVVV